MIRLILITLCLMGTFLPPAVAAEERLPTYFPNTEELRPDEMRITALGTGLPTPLTRAQASTAWMVELGNGDAFLFDLGTGSMTNLFGLRPDFSKLDKVFLSHLHTDHFGDLDAFIVGSWLSGRYTPLHVYGGTGSTPELGTKAAVDALMKAMAWDIKGRTGILPDAGGEVITHEFDYKQENQVVYQENGVTITSWPAIHSLDGSVSYRLEWNDLSFVFGGDTRPNKWFIKYATNADFVIHECFPTPAGLAAFNDWKMRPATFVTSYIHTPPEGFGKVMSAVRPRMAVAFHTVLLPDIMPGMLEGIRKTYDGPLTIASDRISDTRSLMKLWYKKPQTLLNKRYILKESTHAKQSQSHCSRYRPGRHRPPRRLRQHAERGITPGRQRGPSTRGRQQSGGSL